MERETKSRKIKTTPGKKGKNKDIRRNNRICALCRMRGGEGGE